MGLSTVISATLQGVEAIRVDIEVNTGQSGDPRVVLVGLPDAAVKESNDRVMAALSNSGFRVPEARTTINLAPGNMRKEGPIFDLPLALGILESTGQMQAGAQLADFLIAGELGLSGSARPIRGGLAYGILARKLKRKGVLLPKNAAEEAALVQDIEVYAIDSLSQARSFLMGQLSLSPLVANAISGRASEPQADLDFSDVKGQHQLRRAIEIAVAGNHNILIIGPPGSGKSMVAKRIPTIMPEPTVDEYLEILGIHSAAGRTIRQAPDRLKRPFRAPHHTISDVGLLGGGSIPGPGEISLAHQGVLFLDELPEFRRSTLEVLRQPLEDGEVTISRSAGKITLPASFMLVAAMNPTPSGYTAKDGRLVNCSSSEIQRYRSRISGPLLDRIDIHVEAPAIQFEDLSSKTAGETSASMRQRIQKARAIQLERFKKYTFKGNARMNKKALETFCALTPDQLQIMQKAMHDLKLSARAYDRILKVARTIADLAQADTIEFPHLLEAIQYRTLDRELFF
jgi:magnesium chelatase family protein